MRFWLIECGEPLPTDRAKGRLWRIGLLAEILLKRGHEVTWWTSTFDHSHKIHRYNEDTFLQLNDRYTIVLLKGMAYGKNISIRRLLNHRTIAKKIAKLMPNQPLPDLIHCCLPTIENCAVATDFGLSRSVPVVVDIRDLWPDIWLEVLHPILRAPAKSLLSPIFKKVHQSCKVATAITGMSSSFVSKGLSYANRSPNQFDHDFPFGYPEIQLTSDQMNEAFEFWKGYGLERQNGSFVVCFLGALSSRMELKTLIMAANRVKASRDDIRFVICGKGEAAEKCRKWAAGNANIIFPGWIGLAEIWTLMQMASVGTVPYPSSEDFSASIPNKTIEYLAGGLPILSSVKGTLQELLSRYNCGITYENHDEESLASIILELQADSEKLSAMSRNAIDLYQKKFAAGIVYTAMSEHLENIASHDKKKAVR